MLLPIGPLGHPENTWGRERKDSSLLYCWLASCVGCVLHLQEWTYFDLVGLVFCSLVPLLTSLHPFVLLQVIQALHLLNQSALQSPRWNFAETFSSFHNPTLLIIAVTPIGDQILSHSICLLQQMELDLGSLWTSSKLPQENRICGLKYRGCFSIGLL